MLLESIGYKHWLLWHGSGHGFNLTDRLKHRVAPPFLSRLIADSKNFPGRHFERFPDLPTLGALSISAAPPEAFPSPVALDRATAPSCRYAPRSITKPPTVPSELPKAAILLESNAVTTASLISNESRRPQRTDCRITVLLHSMEGCLWARARSTSFLVNAN